MRKVGRKRKSPPRQRPFPAQHSNQQDHATFISAPASAGADMKLVVSGPFESGGFFRFAGDFSSPLRSRSFPFLCKKENMALSTATLMPVFPPHFQPAESIRVHVGPRSPDWAKHIKPVLRPTTRWLIPPLNYSRSFSPLRGPA